MELGYDGGIYMLFLDLSTKLAGRVNNDANFFEGTNHNRISSKSIDFVFLRDMASR